MVLHAISFSFFSPFCFISNSPLPLFFFFLSSFSFCLLQNDLGYWDSSLFNSLRIHFVSLWTWIHLLSLSTIPISIVFRVSPSVDASLRWVSLIHHFSSLFLSGYLIIVIKNKDMTNLEIGVWQMSWWLILSCRFLE